MADKIKAIKIKQKNGTYSEEVPISVNVQNVQWDENNHTLLDALGSVDISSSGKGNLQHQIDELDGDKISTNEFNSRLNDFLKDQISADTTDWLDDNVNPIGSAVIVDKTLTIDGAAADALAVKTELNKKADASNTYTKAEVNAAIDAKKIEVDDTLSITGTAADAKVVGDEFNQLQTNLTNNVNDLKSVLNNQDLFHDEIPDTTQTYIFSNGSVSQIIHSRNDISVRTDTFTYGSSSITEVRTLNTGESLIIDTDLLTLEAVVKYIIEKSTSNNDFNLVPYYKFDSAESWTVPSLYPSLLVTRSGNDSCMICSLSGEEPIYEYPAQNAQSPIATSYYPIPIPDGFNRYTISVPSGYVLWAYHFTYNSQNKTYINHTSSGNWFQNYTKNIENNGNMFLTATIRKSDFAVFDENSLPSNVTIIFEKV